MAFEAKDKTERFMDAAKERARAALHEPSPKLTSLEKGMLKALKSRQRPVKHNQKASVRG
jgi:hypothetical protein|tara:strand:+ start:438 stop:617 length:180 start_codon:yes stop_codon:yes gene_type:complete